MRFLLALLLLVPASAFAQDSGGPLVPEQAAYDVTYYGLDVAVHPKHQRIDGTLTMHAAVVQPLEYMVLNLDHRLSIERVWLADTPTRHLSVERRDNASGRNNEVRIALPNIRRPGDRVHIQIAYSGAPRVAPRAPWDGGFSWEQTPNGASWIATSCQTIGADVWWPMKDHPSDEPDSMDIAVTVPKPLRTASNGVLRNVSTTDSTRTDHWHVSTSINPYTVALNIAPYVRLDTTHTSPDGGTMPVSFYALPDDSSRARNALPHFLEHVQFLEETLTPYPFRTDKYGIAQTPFLGMEHQTIIAYGNNFRLNGGLGYGAGFDALHFHELAHEWFGNCLTVRDWKDFWLHEGFATYMEALYAEHLHGSSGYRTVIEHNASRFAGNTPIAYAHATTAQDVYSGDVYFKGALVLHTLRYLLGDADFRETLRRFVTGAADASTAACRHVTTADFVQVAETVSGQPLDGFFRVYLYQAALPRLVTQRSGGTLTLRWANVGDGPFRVPVPVSVNGTIHRVPMNGGSGTLDVPADADIALDPDGWLLRDAG